MNKNDFDNKIDQFIEKNPKLTMKLVLMMFCTIWMSVVGVLGLVLYLIFSKILKMQWWLILAIGILLALEVVLISGISLKAFLFNGFAVNKAFWKLVFTQSDLSPIIYLLDHAGIYLFGFPVLIAGILNLIDLIKESPHKPTINAIQNGVHSQEKNVSEKEINKIMRRCKNLQVNGVLLGVSTFTAKPIIIPDHFINQIVLVLGTTGSGKTVTLQRFYQRAIANNYPLIVIDGKPTQDNINWLKRLADTRCSSFL